MGDFIFVPIPTQPWKLPAPHTATQGIDSGRPGKTLEGRATPQRLPTALRGPVLALPCTPGVGDDRLPQGSNAHTCKTELCWKPFINSIWPKTTRPSWAHTPYRNLQNLLLQSARDPNLPRTPPQHSTDKRNCADPLPR